MPKLEQGERKAVQICNANRTSLKAFPVLVLIEGTWWPEGREEG